MVAITTPADNAHVFDFFRERANFVETYDGFESFAMWGPVVDALAILHARRLNRPTGKNNECFRTALTDLVRFIDLGTISVPILFDTLKARANHPDASRLFRVLFQEHENGLASDSQLWTATKDRGWAKAIEQSLTNASQDLRRTVN